MMRDKGTGTVFYQEKRNRWIGYIEAGWTKRGTRGRKAVTGATKRIVQQKIAEKLRQGTTEASSTASVKSYADTWLVRVADHLRPNSLMVTTAAVTSWIVPTIGHKRLDRLNPGDIRAVSKAILDAGLSPATASRYRGVLSKMLKDARLDGHLVPGVVDDVEGVPLGESNREAIRLDHAILLLSVIAEHDDGSRFATALMAGPRPAECRGLTWECVDLDAGYIDVSWQLQELPYRISRDRTSGFKVPVGYVARHLEGRWHLVRPKTKSGQRYVPMVPWLVESLRQWQTIAPPSPHGLVWSDDGRPLDGKKDRAAWHEIVAEARRRQVAADVKAGDLMPEYDLYSCRHTTATLLREAGIPDETIIAIVGHSSIASTRTYIHVRQEPLRAALTAVADRLGLTSGPAAIAPVS